MFDSNEMRELAAIKSYRYERNGGGGGFKVHNSSKAYDDARGYRDMTSWDQLVYRTNMLWRQAASQAKSDFKWDCHVLTLDTVNGEIPF